MEVIWIIVSEGKVTLDQLYTIARVLQGAWEFAQPIHTVCALWTWKGL